MGLRNVVFAVGLAVFASACGTEQDGSIDGSAIPEDPRSEELKQLDQALGSIDMNNLMTDDDMTAYPWVSVAQVQSFLQSYGSYLATYTDPAWGKTAATLIVERSRAYNINPIYMLARIETESGLVRSGTSNNLDKATGCKCPDSGGCDTSWSGFGNQVECSAMKFRGYLSDLETKGYTISGWKPGAAKDTLDPCTVVPANNATAALYTYTPWVGAYGSQCGTTQWGGSSLVSLRYKDFRGNAIWTPPTIIVDSNNSNNDSSVARISVSSNWVASSGTAGYYGTGYYYASVAAVSDAAEFWFYVTEDGARTIDAWWTAGTNRSASAPFVAFNSAGVKLGTVNVNQQYNGSRWNQLGTFNFTRGWNKIALSRWTSSGSVVIADAVRVR